MNLLEKLLEEQRRRNKCKEFFNAVRKGEYAVIGDPSVGEPVFLNIYDMFPITNKIFSKFGFGVFHVGVEVYGQEYSFRGEYTDESSIYAVTPKKAGVVMKLRESIFIGNTFLNEHQVKNEIEKLKLTYIGKDYHLLRKNCCSFSKEFTKILCQKKIPKWINRLARGVRRMRIVEAIISRESFMP